MTTKTIQTIPADRQAELQRSGLLATADQMWASPCGTFVLEPSRPEVKKRRRLYLGAAAR